jgi:hypothetical protein
MIAGVHGRLLATSFIRDALPAMPGVADPPPAVARRLAEWWHRIDATLGPSSGPRAVADVALTPLLDLLGLAVAARLDAQDTCRLRLDAGGQPGAIALATGWGESLDRSWRSTVVGAISADARWCLCCNGLALRLVDARRTWSRDFLEFELEALGHETEAQAALWALLHASALSGDPARLDRAVDLAGQHGVQVCRALGTGVLEALEALLGALTRTSRRPAALLWEQSLTVLYRVLFLLFAEARGLVPTSRILFPLPGATRNRDVCPLGSILCLPPGAP